MSKFFVRQINLCRWFSPSDLYAAHVARVRILCEDFALEMWGLHATRIKRFEGHPVKKSGQNAAGDSQDDGGSSFAKGAAHEETGP